MSKNYYDPSDLRKFSKITEWSEELGNKFFEYYGKVFEEGALTGNNANIFNNGGTPGVDLLYLFGPFNKTTGDFDTYADTDATPYSSPAFEQHFNFIRH